MTSPNGLLSRLEGGGGEPQSILIYNQSFAVYLPT